MSACGEGALALMTLMQLGFTSEQLSYHQGNGAVRYRTSRARIPKVGGQRVVRGIPDDRHGRAAFSMDSDRAHVRYAEKLSTINRVHWRWQAAIAELRRSECFGHRAWNRLTSKNDITQATLLSVGSGNMKGG